MNVRWSPTSVPTIDSSGEPAATLPDPVPVNEPPHIVSSAKVWTLPGMFGSVTTSVPVG